MPSVATRNFLAFLPLVAAILFNPVPAAARAPVEKKPATAVSTPPLPKGAQLVTSVEGISEYRLANGLKVLLFPDPSKQTITVNITYLVGSRYENYGETGMAHLLEHLLFKGTPGHRNIPQELTQRGARPNGSTWLDRTNYFETFSASDDNLNWALGLEADRMVHSFIARKDLDSEMTVVRNEFESGENKPFSVVLKRLAGAAYDWHNYGKSTIGNKSDIENVSIPRLQAFYHEYYQPDNAVLLVAGNINAPKTLALVAKYFAPIPKPKRVIEPQYTVEPTQDGERVVDVRRVGDTQLVAAAYHIASAQHPDSAPLTVMALILGDTPTGRLHKALVESGKATAAGTFAMSGYDPGLLINFATLRKEDQLDAARDELIKVVENFASAPPSDEEMTRAKTKFASGFDLLSANTEQLGIALSEAIAAGDWRLVFWMRDQVKAVTAADVQRVGEHYLKRSNRTLGEFIPTDHPDRADIPPRPDVAALLKDYKGSATLAAGEAFDPSQANIDKRTIRSALPGGMKLALLPKQTRGNVVDVQLQLHFGDEQGLQDRKWAGSLAGSMLLRGTRQHSRKQLSDEFDRLKAEVNLSGGPDGAFAVVQTVRENLPQVLQLIAECLKESIFPVDEFNTLKREVQTHLDSQRREPQGVAVNELQRLFNVYPQSDPRYVGSFDEQQAAMSKVSAEDARRFHDEFYGASNAELAVVGDFDAQQIGMLAEGLFGNWQSPHRYERLAAVYRDIPPTTKMLATPDKANAFFITRENLRMRDDDTDYPALELGNYMLGGGFLNSRLSTRIRQKEGLSYGVGSQLSVSSLDQAGAFSGYAIAAPQNMAKLETAFKEELTRALKDGFTADEVASAKRGLLDTRKLNRAQDGVLAPALANNLYLGRTFQWSADFEKKLAQLTAEQIRDALRRHIDPKGLTVIEAGDFSKAP